MSFTTNQLWKIAHKLGIEVELDIPVNYASRKKQIKSLGWGWWNQDCRPWHYAKKGKWSAREALEDGIKTMLSWEKE